MEKEIENKCQARYSRALGRYNPGNIKVRTEKAIFLPLGVEDNVIKK